MGRNGGKKKGISIIYRELRLDGRNAYKEILQINHVFFYLSLEILKGVIY